jgi:predicted small secreted protein
VASFKYLGVILNDDNNNQIDLQERIKNAKKTYFMLQKFFKNKNISRKLKLRLKNTIIDKTLTYASGTWTLTKRDRKQLNVFERKVYRGILGPVYDNEKENWRILTNKEIYASVKKPTIIETIRLHRLRWF